MWRYVLCWKVKDGDRNVTLCAVLEGKGWGLQCDAYMLCCNAKDGDCNVTLCAVLEGKVWGLQCDAMCCVGR